MLGFHRSLDTCDVTGDRKITVSTDMLVLLQLGLNMSARETAAIDNLVTRTIPEAPAEAISPAQKLLISTITLTDMGCLFYYTEEKKLFFFIL